MPGSKGVRGPSSLPKCFRTSRSTRASSSPWHHRERQIAAYRSFSSALISLRMRSHCCEHRVCWSCTYRAVARHTPNHGLAAEVTLTTGDHEGHYHPLTDLETRVAAPDLDHLAHEFGKMIRVRVRVRVRVHCRAAPGAPGDAPRPSGSKSGSGRWSHWDEIGWVTPKSGGPIRTKSGGSNFAKSCIRTSIILFRLLLCREWRSIRPTPN